MARFMYSDPLHYGLRFEVSYLNNPTNEEAGRSVGRWRPVPRGMGQVWSNLRTSEWRIRSGSCYTPRPLGISDICPAGSEV